MTWFHQCSSSVCACVVLAGGLAVVSAPTLAQDAAVASADAPMLEEVVVTARKRAENLQDVPISITAISGDELTSRGAQAVTDLFGSVPNLYFSQGNFSPTTDFTYLVIRGVGAAPALDPSVGIFIDGVYQPSLGFDIGFLDLERVEVLRGPQGTLFGRNTLAGALSLVTREPSADPWVRLTAGVESFGGQSGQISANGALHDNLFINGAVSYAHSDGYIRNITRGTNQLENDRLSTRVGLRWLPTDQLEVRVSGDYTDIKANELGYGVTPGTTNYEVANNLQTTNPRQIGGAAVTVNATLSPELTITSITGYRVGRGHAFWDADGTDSTELFFNPNFPSTPRVNDGFDERKTTQHIASQELRFAGGAPHARLNWLVGLYGFRETWDLDRQGSFESGAAAPGGPNTVFDGTLAGGDGVFIRQTKTGGAIFGQLDYKLTEKLSVALGARENRERATADSIVSFLVPITETFYFPFELNLHGERTFKDFTPSTSLTYKWNESVSTYATASKGFKAGGFQKFPANPIDAEGFAPEKSTNYELGAKLSGPRYRLDASVYKVYLTDQQVNVTVLVDTGGGTTTPVGGTRNAGESTVTGAELEGQWQVSSSFRLEGNVAYNDAKFTDYVDAQGLQRAGSAFERFPYVPKTTGALRLVHDATLADYKIESSLAWRCFGSYYVGDGGVFSPFEQIPSYSVSDLRASISKDSWTVTTYIDNLFDKYAITQRLAPFSNPNDRFDTPIAPRQFGVKFSLLLR